MPGDVSLYIMNDSDSHIQLNDGMVVVVGREALHIEEVSESDGLLTKWSAKPVKWFPSSGWNHWSGGRR